MDARFRVLLAEQPQPLKTDEKPGNATEDEQCASEALHEFFIEHVPIVQTIQQNCQSG